MWPLHSKKYSRQAIFLHDGRTWYGRIFSWKKQAWECLESVSQLSPNPRELPHELLSCAVKHSARRVRILLPNDILSVSFKLPGGLEPEEIHTALTYEVANEIQIDAGKVRMAAVRESQFCMGGSTDTLLVSSFEREWLQHYAQACKKEGLIFDGIGAMELAALNCHARREPNAQFLLLRSQHGFHVTPGTESIPFSVRSVPFGMETLEETLLDEERAGRIARQFRHCKTHVHVWCTELMSDMRKQKLAGLFGADVGMEYVDFADRVTPVMMHAAWQGTVGQVTCGCAMVALPGAAKSPYRAGSWLFLVILLLTGLYLGFTWKRFNDQLSAVDQRAHAWEQLLQERKKLAGEVNRLKALQSHCVAMEKLMQEPILPHGLQVLLDTLQTHIPTYTCIDTVMETSRRHYEIRGKTFHQAGLIELNEALANALRDRGLILEPGQITQADSGIRQEKAFIYRVLPGKW